MSSGLNAAQSPATSSNGINNLQPAGPARDAAELQADQSGMGSTLTARRVTAEITNSQQ